MQIWSSVSFKQMKTLTRLYFSWGNFQVNWQRVDTDNENSIRSAIKWIGLKTNFLSKNLIKDQHGHILSTSQVIEYGPTRLVPMTAME